MATPRGNRRARSVRDTTGADRPPLTSTAAGDAAADADDARYARSLAAFDAARAVMPGGVSSPVRACTAVGRDPITIRSGKDATLTDVDGNDYIDYVGSYGPLILGHAYSPVVAAISKAAAKGATFGLPTEAETALAEKVIDAVPSVELVRFVNSGTEATMSAIRLARAATGRPSIIKCIGNYHGHSDALLVQAGSGATTLGTPSSPGVPEAVTRHTRLVPYNDAEAIEAELRNHASEIACVCVEPIAGNMGCIPPAPGYLQRLRELCDQYDTLLLFDEVMTGFRVAYGGAQSLYNVTPDLTCLGKIIGGGLPCAAYGGREDLMRQVAPDGPVYQAGTLSGNPLAMAAGLATLESLEDPTCYEELEAMGATLEAGLVKQAERANVAVTVQRVGSMICVFFLPDPVKPGSAVRDYAHATRCRTDRFAAFYGSMLDQGIMLPPSQYETWFLSTAHEASHIRTTLKAARTAFLAAAEVA